MSRLAITGTQGITNPPCRIPIRRGEFRQQFPVELFVSHQALDAGFPINAGNNAPRLSFPIRHISPSVKYCGKIMPNMPSLCNVSFLGLKPHGPPKKRAYASDPRSLFSPLFLMDAVPLSFAANALLKGSTASVSPGRTPQGMRSARAWPPDAALALKPFHWAAP